jgi:hypothetical protein
MANKAAGTYVVQFSVAMLAYVVVLIVSLPLLNALGQSPWRIPVALAPVVPALFGLFAFLRFLGQMDELQRRIQLDAIAFGFGMTAVLTFAYGFLENAGFPHVSWIWILPLMLFLWGIGNALAAARYR